MLEGGRERFLVFAHHKLVLDHITAELGKKVGKMYRYHAVHKPDMQRNIILLALKSPLGSTLIRVCRCGQRWAHLSLVLLVSGLLSFTTKDC